MIAPVFTGTMEKGWPQFPDDVVAKMIPHFATMEGKPITMCVKLFRTQRSNQQNAYYWGVVIKLIADHAGYRSRDELQQVHDTLRGMFLVRDGLWGKEIVLSTTSLSTVEFEEYASQIRRWAAIALDLSIPEPNECEIPAVYEKGE